MAQKIIKVKYFHDKLTVSFDEDDLTDEERNVIIVALHDLDVMQEIMNNEADE